MIPDLERILSDLDHAIFLFKETSKVMMKQGNFGGITEELLCHLSQNVQKEMRRAISRVETEIEG